MTSTAWKYLEQSEKAKEQKVLLDFCHDKPKEYQKSKQEGQGSKEKAKVVRCQSQSLWHEGVRYLMEKGR